MAKRMRSTAAVSQMRVAQLRSDAAMQTAAEAELAVLGVRNSERMCRLIAPMRSRR